MVQVKFHLTSNNKDKQYGYLLAEPKSSLKEVVGKILESYNNGIINFSQSHLYNIGRKNRQQKC